MAARSSGRVSSSLGFPTALCALTLQGGILVGLALGHTSTFGISTGTGLCWPAECVACLTARPEPHGVGRGALARKWMKMAWGNIKI